MDNKVINKLTDRLNETGFPFQEWCFNLLKESSIIPFQELPFTFPGSSHGIFNDVSSLDILGFKRPQDTWRENSWVYYFIECKKSKVGIKNWCFIKTKRSENKYKGGISPFFVGEFSETDKGLINFNGKFIDHQSLFGNNPDVVIHGYEVNNLFDSINRNQEEKIYKAAMQSIKATAWMESLPLPNFPGNNYGIDELVKGWGSGVTPRAYPRLIFLPLLVTTSDIFVANIDVNKIEKITGEMKSDDVVWEKRDWIIYDIGLPDWLQNDQYPINTRGIIVINCEALKGFLEKNFELLEVL